MKKLTVLLVTLLLVSFMATGAFALLKVAALGAMYSYTGGSLTGFGAQVSLPLIPLVDTNLEGVIISGTGYQIIPVTLNAEFGFPLTPFYVGGGVGTALFSASGATVPTPIIYNIHVGWRKTLAPLTSAFVQAGYEAMSLSLTAGTFPLPSLNLSGISVKAGASFGL